jgi:lipoprotein-anchoring transpeptidase ErfK/SrfK
MSVFHRISILLVIAALAAGCAQTPSRPAPERKPADTAATVDAAGAPPSDEEVADEAEGSVDGREAPVAERALTIRIASQSFVYSEDDQVVRTGPISSGREGHGTPRGTFSVLSKQKDKVSSRYTNQLGWQAWMPYSIQFYGHYFLHEGWLPGYPDSAGCVRVGEKDARFLFERMKIGDPVSVVD